MTVLTHGVGGWSCILSESGESGEIEAAEGGGDPGEVAAGGGVLLIPGL